MAYDPKKSRWVKTVRKYGEEENARGVLQLVYGEFGSGKTTYAATAKNVLFVDIDRGDNIATRAAALNYVYFRPEGLYDKLKTFLLDLRDQKDIFDPDGGPNASTQTIAIDSWTKLNESLLVEIAGEDTMENSKPSWDAYMKLKNRQIFLVKLLKEIAFARRVNVIVTALPMVEGDEGEKMKRDAKEVSAKSGFTVIHGVPNLVGSYKRQIGAEFDEVYYLENFSSGGHYNRLWTVPHNDYQAKSRAGLPASIIDPTFEGINTLAQEALEARKKSTKA